MGDYVLEYENKWYENLISINRSGCPKLLTDSKELWDAKVAAGMSKHCIKHNTEITVTLKSDARFKCMYCEGASSGSEIEHIKPFSKYKCLAHEWTNLGWACPPCNKRKSNTEGFIDPYIEDPCEKIGFKNHVAFLRDESSLEAKITVDRVLNHTEMQMRRKMALDNFVELHNSPNQEMKQVLERQFTKPSQDFSAMFIDYLNSCRLN